MKLEVKDLHKSFGEEEVLHGISFSTCSGKAFGLLGRNGAGKTTTLRILMDIFKADSGTILLDNKAFCFHEHQVGYLPEERGLYPRKPVDKQLIYFGRLRGLSYEVAQSSMQKWLRRLDIIKYEKTNVEQLSKGNQQKVQLAQTLICNPDIVILDEPFTGIDPVNARLLQDVIKELVRDGKLVIFSSHQMNYVEEICEEIAIMRDGNIVLNGKLDEIKRNFGANRLVVKASNMTLERLERICFETLSELVSVFDRKKEGLILEMKKGKTSNELLQALINQKVEVEAFGIFEPSLTDIFVLKAGDLG